MPGRENERRSSSVLVFLRSVSPLRETDLIRGSVCPTVRGFFPFGAGREQFQQHTVALPFEFGDRAAIRFLQYAVDNGLLYLGTEFSDRAEIFPPCRQRSRELFHKMLNSAWTTAQMEQEIWTHQAPT